MKNSDFNNHMTDAEKEAWIRFKNVTESVSKIRLPYEFKVTFS